MYSKQTDSAEIEEAISHFKFDGKLLDYTPYGSGHINDTFLLRFLHEDQTVKKYILQKINHHIFQNPEHLMQNIEAVSSFLRQKIIQNNGDPERETINIIKTNDGKNYYHNSIGSYWRGCRFIENAFTLDQVNDPEDFYQSAVAFGRFQKLLSDFPAHILYETIPDFHNTPKRYQRLKESVIRDTFGRVSHVTKEIEFCQYYESFYHLLEDAFQKGKLPLRVTHNDTKLNNVMLDKSTHKAICVIDLDTVMPGFSVNDFGDSIRFGATTAAEDEQDLSKVTFNLELFEQYTKGYLEGCDNSLTDTELELLPIGAKMMTLESGIRFLTDYLEGDVYFKTNREGHNLDRCRTQLKLVSEMELHWDEMKKIILKYSKKD